MICSVGVLSVRTFVASVLAASHSSTEAFVLSETVVLSRLSNAVSILLATSPSPTKPSIQSLPITFIGAVTSKTPSVFFKDAGAKQMGKSQH